MKIIYLKMEKHIEVLEPKIMIEHFGKVFCVDQRLKEEIKQIEILDLTKDDFGKKTISIMVIIEAITNAIGEEILIHSIGENEIVINYSKSDGEKKALVLLKVFFVALTTFLGGAFAIMTYNEDVGVTGVFDKIYYVVMGTERSGGGVLELTYGIGIALGIIIFFNHFGKKKLTSDPTPMEIEMEKYEEDICNTLLKEASRKDETIDIS